MDREQWPQTSRATGLGEIQLLSNTPLAIKDGLDATLTWIAKAAIDVDALEATNYNTDVSPTTQRFACKIEDIRLENYA